MRKISIVTVIVVLLFAAGCKHHESEHAEPQKFLVTSPLQMDTVVYKEYVCQIKAYQHIELRALEKGYLQNIFVDEGQSVKKGQPMFQIMPMVYQAEMQTAQAEANFAEIEYQNTKSLADSNVVSKNELAMAKAKLDKAKAELQLAQTHLSFTDINAPFDGIMDHFSVRLGSLLDEGDLLSTLSDNSKMWVYFNVPEAEYLEYITKPKDSTSRVELRMANGKMFETIGKVETIEADFNNETGNIAFRATFQNPHGILRHGETGDILMPTILKDAIIIPQKATFDILDKKYVYVVGADNIVKARQITVGTEMSHLYVITEGLSKEDKILLEGIGKVNANQEIKYDFIDQHKVLSELIHLHAE